MVKGYKAPKHAYAGNNPDFYEFDAGRHYSDEDEWLFAQGRKSDAEPWREAPCEPIRVLPKLHPKKVTLPRILRLCEMNSRVCPKLPCWAEMDKFMTIRGPVPWRVRGSMYSFEWGRTSDAEKQNRLRQQLEYADSVGTLRIFARFLYALREDEWHHFEEPAT